MPSIRGRVLMTSVNDSEEFAASLKRRAQAAKGLEKDLLTEVPMLYGSPGPMEPRGDPGILLAQAHQAELLRRNGGGVPPSSGRRSDTPSRFGRTIVTLVVLLFVLINVFD
jgi:hypothetical protein